MADRRLVWQLFPSYLLVALSAIVGLSFVASSSLRDSYLEHTRTDLHARAIFASSHFGQLIQRGSDASRLAEAVQALGDDTGTRITLIAPDGQVLADSSGNAARMENYAGRPEVVGAFAGSITDSTRFSLSENEDLMYVAAPIMKGSDVIAVVRLSVAMHGFDASIRAFRSRVFIAAALFAGLAVLVNWWVSTRLARPIEQLTQEAKRYARGERQEPLPRHSALELRELSDAVTYMAAELEDRIADAREEKSEREAVLRSMVEGVVAVDTGKRVLSINRAASSLLNIESATAIGRHLAEVVRNTALLNLVDRVVSGEEYADVEFELRREGQQFVQARAAMLRKSTNEPIGAVVVLNDVTRLKKLEQVRKDFVSNVSHELKTPLTSVKGFVETLLEGAIDDPENGRRFLEIIRKHVDRLNAIIEDLLTLSRLEQEEGPGPQAMLEIAPVSLPIEEAVQVCQSAANDKRVTIERHCPPDLLVEMNAPLIEQCVVNLLDNAIKYSEAGKRIVLSVERRNGSVCISVADQGSGISSEHINRLFERFYRVDQARSRILGGTGLGLSIVRHIVELHRGRIEVESELGRGSTFRITLPAAGASSTAEKSR